MTDPHGARAAAGAPVKVDSIRPVIGGLRIRGSTITYRLSEPARVTVRLQQLKRKRWRNVRVLRQDGVAGRNRLRATSRARSAKRAPRVRYRAEAIRGGPGREPLEAHTAAALRQGAKRLRHRR